MTTAGRSPGAGLMQARSRRGQLAGAAEQLRVSLARPMHLVCTDVPVHPLDLVPLKEQRVQC